MTSEVKVMLKDCRVFPLKNADVEWLPDSLRWNAVKITSGIGVLTFSRHEIHSINLKVHDDTDYIREG